MQLEGAVALQDFADMRQLVEIVFYPLHPNHLLAITIHCQCLVLKTLGSNFHLWQLPDFLQQRVVGWCRLALDGCHLQLRVHLCEERCHQVVETVEHRQRNHQSHRSHGDTNDGNAADDVDGVR